MEDAGCYDVEIVGSQKILHIFYCRVSVLNLPCTKIFMQESISKYALKNRKNLSY